MKIATILHIKKIIHFQKRKLQQYGLVIFIKIQNSEIKILYLEIQTLKIFLQNYVNIKINNLKQNSI